MKVELASPSVSVSNLGNLYSPFLQLCSEENVPVPRKTELLPKNASTVPLNSKLGCLLSLRAFILRGQQVKDGVTSLAKVLDLDH